MVDDMVVLILFIFVNYVIIFSLYEIDIIVDGVRVMNRGIFGIIFS